MGELSCNLDKVAARIMYQIVPHSIQQIMRVWTRVSSLHQSVTAHCSLNMTRRLGGSHGHMQGQAMNTATTSILHSLSTQLQCLHLSNLHLKYSNSYNSVSILNFSWHRLLLERCSVWRLWSWSLVWLRLDTANYQELEQVYDGHWILETQRWGNKAKTLFLLPPAIFLIAG